jgi:small redox-active disulfide protein 2
MIIKILGSGCAKCKALEAVTREAVKELDIQAEVRKVSEMQEIMAYPITMTPALVIDDKVMISGKVPSKAEMVSLLRKVSAK